MKSSFRTNLICEKIVLSSTTSDYNEFILNLSKHVLTDSVEIVLMMRFKFSVTPTLKHTHDMCRGFRCFQDSAESGHGIQVEVSEI